MVDVLIQSFNEEKNLPHTLASLAGWPGQIFLVDSGSTDRTTDIAREFGATVVHHDWEGYARQKNWALDNLPFQSDWILILDADEAVSPELRQEILELASRPPDSVPEAGFLINRVFVFMGRRIWHCGYFPSWNLRLFKRGKARYEDRSVHEHMICDGKVGKLRHLLIHEDRRGLEHFFAKHNRYSSLEARELFDNPEPWPGLGELMSNPIRRRRFLKSRVLTKLPLVWMWRFIYMYVLRGGFLDGRAGWLLSNFISAYEFSIHIKYRELQMRGATVERGAEGLAQPEGALGLDLPDFAPRPSRLALARMSRGRAVSQAVPRASAVHSRAAEEIEVVVLHGGGEAANARAHPLPHWAREVPVLKVRMAEAPDGERNDLAELRWPGGGAAWLADAPIRPARERPWTLILAEGDRVDAEAWDEICAFAGRHRGAALAALVLRRRVCRHGRCINTSSATLAPAALFAPRKSVWDGAAVSSSENSRHRVSHHWEDSIESVLSRELWHARRWALERARSIQGPRTAVPREARWTGIMIAPAAQFLRLMFMEGVLVGGRAAWSAAFIAASANFVKRLLLREQFDPRLHEAAIAEQRLPPLEQAGSAQQRAAVLAG